SASFLAIAAAFFTAGVGKNSAWLIVMSPVPLQLGVLQMTRNARLQLQLTTYLAAFTPFTATSWEKDVAVVRRRFWAEAKDGVIAGKLRASEFKAAKTLARHITNPSAWDLWLLISLLVGIGVDAVPLFLGLDDDLAAFLAGLALLSLGTLWLARDIARIEPERERWEALWARYREEVSEPKHSA
ncbi:MAG TPA: hypothetical protein VFU11_02900, partial [Solirubrobacterales bacterium]|nr:hypothetical protein [Solirubrobacterales bacterium]